MRIMKTINRVIRHDKVVDKLVCNLCGNDLKRIINSDRDYDFCGLEEVQGVIGQSLCEEGSCKGQMWDDGKPFSFSLCEKCLEDLIAKFKIPAYWAEDQEND